MKKIVLLALFMGTALLFSGCSNLEIASKFNHITVEEGYTPEQYTYTNYGYYFLNWIPIFSGTVVPDDAFALFTDTVTTDKAVLALTNAAYKRGATRIENVVTHKESHYNWYTLFYFTRNVQVSATVLND